MTIPLGWAQTRCAQTRSARTLRLLSVGLVAALGVAAAPVGKVQFTDTKLKNGLRVIISEDHAAPVYTIVVNYNVGSRDERKGRTGFAHLFEHMMFKGSENVGQNEHPYLIFMNGGSMNGTTNKDRTMYYETLPANQLDLGLFLEADRMKSLAITKENLENQRNAVQEERRQRRRQPAVRQDVRSDRRARLRQLRLRALRDRVDGRPERGERGGRGGVLQDLLRAEQRRHRRSSATSTRRRRSQRWSSTSARFRRQPAPAAVDMSEPPQKEERRLTLEDALARLPRIDMAYKVPPSASPDDDAIGGAGDDSVRRTQRALLRGHRPAEAAVARRLGVLRRVARARPLPDHRDGAARQDPGGARSRHRRGDRAAEDGADRGLGDREGANQRAGARSSAASAARSARPFSCRRTRCSTTIPAASTPRRNAWPK